MTKFSTGQNQTGVSLPLLGTVQPNRLAWYAGIGAMAAVELIEWPVALAIAAGHAIADRANNPTIKQAGQGAEAA